MALEGTRFSDSAEQHLKEQWLSKLTRVYKMVTATTIETDLQSRLFRPITFALEALDGLMAPDCEAECLCKLNLDRYNASVSYEDTVLVQQYMVELQKVANEYHNTNARVKDISDSLSSVSSKQGLSRLDLAIVARKEPGFKVQIGGFFELKAYPTGDVAGLNDFVEDNNLKSGESRKRAMQGVAQALFYGSVCREMSSTQVFALIYCNHLVRFRFECSESNLILMETLESQSEQEPQSVRDLLKGIRDGTNPMVHDLRNREGGDACLKWIGLMHLNARTMLDGYQDRTEPSGAGQVGAEQDSAIPQSSSTSWSASSLSDCKKPTLPITRQQAGPTMLLDTWLEDVDQEGWEEREEEQVLDATLAAMVMDLEGYRVLRISRDHLESFSASSIVGETGL